MPPPLIATRAKFSGGDMDSLSHTETLSFFHSLSLSVTWGIHELFHMSELSVSENCRKSLCLYKTLSLWLGSSLSLSFSPSLSLYKCLSVSQHGCYPSSSLSQTTY